MRALVEERGDAALWEIDSAGTGNYHIGDLPDKRMRIHARRRGYELTHRCRQVCECDFDDFDLIVGMDAMNLRNLHAIAPTPEAGGKIVGMGEFFDIATSYDHVPDPYYEGAEGFELVLDLLQSGCGRLYEEDAGRTKGMSSVTRSIWRGRWWLCCCCGCRSEASRRRKVIFLGLRLDTVR